MTERELKEIRKIASRLEMMLRGNEREHQWLVESLAYVRTCVGDEEKNERNKEAEKESSPHTPYKEKGEEKKKERKEVLLAHSSENEAHPRDERVCVRLKVSDLFAKFWQAYPRKVAKIAAERTFERIVRGEKANAEALVETMCRVLAKQCTSDEWQREDGRYIPYPATWLNTGRWEDESAVDITGGEAPASAASVAWLMGN